VLELFLRLWHEPHFLANEGLLKFEQDDCLLAIGNEQTFFMLDSEQRQLEKQFFPSFWGCPAKINCMLIHF
jgi:hypothetical protein